MMTILKDSLKLETKILVDLCLTAWSQKRLVAGLKCEHSPIEVVVTCLHGEFLGTEVSEHNKLTFIGICCHMLRSWVVDLLAAASESQGGWHCPGPVPLKSNAFV